MIGELGTKLDCKVGALEQERYKQVGTDLAGTAIAILQSFEDCTAAERSEATASHLRMVGIDAEIPTLLDWRGSQRCSGLGIAD